jgi:thiol-disulfide isomerase/thioredoxin
MKHIFTLFFCTLVFASFAQSSGYQIRIKTEEIETDSIFIKAYNVKNKKFENLISIKFEKDITIKDKTPFEAGIYVIEADSAIITEFLISDEKNQKFTISILNDDIKFEGSKENSANREYMKQMFEFRLRERALDAEIQQMRQKEMPNSMMKAYMDTFLVKINNINVEKKSYQEKIIAENKGFLLASIIQSSMAAVLPSQEVLKDMIRMNIYSLEHLFDNFAWKDERLLKTPVLYTKFKAFAQQLLPLEPEFSIPIVLRVLDESKIGRTLFYAFFDYLEHEFGNIKSPYREEELYIAMLDDILKISDLEEARKLRYEYELNLITKNQPGEQAIDFNILLATGDSTNLYAIDSDLLLLYFHRPNCPTCREFSEKMKNMEPLYHALVSKKLKILTVYCEEEEELWRNYLNTGAFKTWMHCWNYDFQISDKRLYDVRIVPTIMVLDKDKKVIKKDIFPNELEDWLKKNL